MESPDGDLTDDEWVYRFNKRIDEHTAYGDRYIQDTVGVQEALDTWRDEYPDDPEGAADEDISSWQ